MPGHRAAYVVAVWLAGAGSVLALDRPIDGLKLVLRRSSGFTEKLVFVSSDPNVPFPVRGSADDPATGTPGGALVELFSTAVPAGVMLPAPAAGWSARRVRTGSFRFLHHDAPDAFSAIRSIVLRQGRSIRMVGRSTGLPLSGPQGAVGIRFTTGTLRSCALFGPGTVRLDREGVFVAQEASAAAIPDCSNASLGGTSTTTTSTTLPGACGDGVVNQPSEECDGTAPSMCTSTGFSCGPPGFSTACRCCSYGGFGTQLVGCCNPYSILIPTPDSGGICIHTRCDPPFDCSGTDQCEPDGTCCSPAGATCLFALLGYPVGLNACCPGLECRGPSPYGVGCCVPDGAACTNDAECCTTHCGGAGACERCRPGGAACTSPFECCSLSCNTSGACNACAPAGASCLDSTTCRSGSCNASTFACNP